MFRRAFLAGVGGTVAVAVAPAIALGSAPSGAPIRLPPSYVTGLEHFSPALAANLKPGDRLSLRREPERRFDPNSIGVYAAGGEKLGYLPGTDSRMLAPLMDAGLLAEAEVTRAVASPRPSLTLSLEIGIPGA